MEMLMSRYILEIECDSSLFKKYLNGSWYPDFDNYRKFLKKQEKNNNSFAKTITRYHLIKPNTNIVETVFSKDLDSVSSYLNKDAILIQSGYGTIKLNNELPNNYIYPSCYISNGVYHDTNDLALRMVGYGSFIIGVCDNPNSVFYKENIEKIEKFRELLHKKNIGYKIYSYESHRDKTLILHYRSDHK